MFTGKTMENFAKSIFYCRSYAACLFIVSIHSIYHTVEPTALIPIKPHRGDSMVERLIDKNPQSSGGATIWFIATSTKSIFYCRSYAAYLFIVSIHSIYHTVEPMALIPKKPLRGNSIVERQVDKIFKAPEERQYGLSQPPPNHFFTVAATQLVFSLLAFTLSTILSSLWL